MRSWMGCLSEGASFSLNGDLKLLAKTGKAILVFCLLGISTLPCFAGALVTKAFAASVGGVTENEETISLQIPGGELPYRRELVLWYTADKDVDTFLKAARTAVGQGERKIAALLYEYSIQKEKGTSGVAREEFDAFRNATSSGQKLSTPRGNTPLAEPKKCKLLQDVTIPAEEFGFTKFSVEHVKPSEVLLRQGTTVTVKEIRGNSMVISVSAQFEKPWYDTRSGTSGIEKYDRTRDVLVPLKYGDLGTSQSGMSGNASSTSRGGAQDESADSRLLRHLHELGTVPFGLPNTPISLDPSGSSTLALINKCLRYSAEVGYVPQYDCFVYRTFYRTEGVKHPNVVIKFHFRDLDPDRVKLTVISQPEMSSEYTVTVQRTDHRPAFHELFSDGRAGMTSSLRLLCNDEGDQYQVGQAMIHLIKAYGGKGKDLF